MATTYKILGQAWPGTSPSPLYTVPATTQAVVSTIHVANTETTSATFQIYICPLGATEDLTMAFAYDVVIPGNSVYAFTEGITLGENDLISVSSSRGGALTFQAFGSEIA